MSTPCPVRPHLSRPWIRRAVPLLCLALLVSASVVHCVDGSRGSDPVSAQVRVAFGHECEPLVVEMIQLAKKSVDVAIFTFTRKRIADALIHAKDRGLSVRMKIDAEQAEFEYTKVLLERMREAGVQVETIKMPEGRHMHHKFAIIDRRTVITGSFNWTRRASQENWENAVTIRSKQVAKRFRAEWNKVGSKDRKPEDD